VEVSGPPASRPCALDDADIDAVLQQMGGKAVPPMSPTT
jgi:hypothetical protein